jgi:hypothetical protein
MKTAKSKPRLPRGKRGPKVDSGQTKTATIAEFEREGLGIAPKE